MEAGDINSISGGATEFIKAFENTGFLSEVYLNKMRKHFNEVRDAMNNTRQNDGNPYELDYDWVTRSQEPDEVLSDALDLLKEAKTVINSDKAIMIDREGSIVAKMSRNNGKWLLDELFN